MCNRKAVSSVVGCLLLITIAVVAGSFFYAYSSGKLTSISAGQSVGGLGTTNVIVEAYNWQSNGNLTFVLRDVGANPFNVTGVLFEAKSLSFTATCPHGYTMMPTESCTIKTQTAILTSGVVYNIDVESQSAAFEFRLTFGTFGVPIGE